MVHRTWPSLSLAPLQLVRFSLFACVLLIWNPASALNTCNLPQLPTTLNSISYLSFNEEVHLHSAFLTNFSLAAQTIRFQVGTESAIRVYVAPHEVDVDLYLFVEGEASPVARSNLGYSTAEVLFSNLTRLNSNYELRFSYFGSSSFEWEDCPSLLIELAIKPLDRIFQVIDGLHKPSSEVLPPSDVFANVGDEDVFYRNNSLYVNSPASSYPIIRNSIRIFSTLAFEVPEFSVPPNSEILWQLAVFLRTDFLTGGSLGLLLSNSSDPPSNCDSSRICQRGIRSSINQVVLDVELRPGPYFLHLFDAVGERDATFGGILFSLEVRLDSEMIHDDYISCRVTRMPESLNGPGGIDPLGYYAFFGSIYLPDASDDIFMIKSSFNLTLESFIRIDISQLKDDLDLLLVDEKSNRYILSLNEELSSESVQERLQPGLYSIYVLSFLSSEYRFCDSILLNLVISPVSSFNFSCPDYPTLNLSSIQPYIDSSSHSFKVVERFQMSREEQEGETYSISFTVPENYIFKAIATSDFLVGSLLLTLQPTTDNDYSETAVSSTQLSNHAYLVQELRAGTYLFNISSQTSQFTPIQGSYPACLPLLLDLLIEPLNRKPASCVRYPRLPSSLNDVGYMAQFDRFSFRNSFLVLKEMQNISVSVNVKSALRFKSFDLSGGTLINLVQGSSGLVIRSHLLTPTSPVFDAILQPNQAYVLSVVATDRSFFETCPTTELQFELSPISQLVMNSDCQLDVPIADILRFDNLPHYSDRVYTFIRSSVNSFSLELPFVTYDPTYVRFVLNQDFLFSNLSLILESQGGSYIEMGQDGFVSLPSGAYILTIKELKSAVPELDGCSQFRFAFEFSKPTIIPDDFPTLSTCPYSYFPNDLNSLDLLSELNPYSLHLEGHALIDSNVQQYRSQLQLNSISLFRINFVYDPRFSVHFDLSKSNVVMLSSQSTEYGEMLGSELASGNYSLEITVVPSNSTLVGAAHILCYTLQYELEVASLSYLEQTASDVVHACPAPRLPPATIYQSLSLQNYSYERTPASGRFLHIMSFNLASQNVIEIDLFYEFLESGLEMKLSGTSSANVLYESQIDYYPAISENRSFLKKILAAGVYNLSISDNGPLNGFSRNSNCIEFQLQINLIEQEDLCNLQHLPYNLFTTSSAFGGPQDQTTGAIRISGRSFKMQPVGSVIVMSFQAPQNATVRAFINGGSNSEILLNMFSDSARSNLVGANLLNNVEPDNEGWRLTGRPVNLTDLDQSAYFLEISFLQIPSSLDSNPCQKFEFLLELAPDSAMASKTACYGWYNPPVGGGLGYGDFLYFGPHQFWKSQMHDPAHQTYIGFFNLYFYYRVTLNMVSSGYLSSLLKYDFTVSNLQLRLQRQNLVFSSTVAKGVPSVAIDEELGFNFLNEINTFVTPGTYYLDILQDMTNFPLDSFSDYCIKFEFNLIYTPDPSPHFIGVLPDSSTNENPLQNFYMYYFFTHPIGFPRENELVQEINAEKAVEMLNLYGGSMQPTDYGLGIERRLLMAEFPASSITNGGKYLLSLECGFFTTADGTVFTDPYQESLNHWYQFAKCDCNNRGQCVTAANNNLLCVCEQPFAGIHCETCQAGYHPVKDHCEANAKCSVNTCSNHGSCIESSDGSLGCLCSSGFASSGDEFCNVCARGYSGYPECRPMQDQVDQYVTCNLPPLPSSLDQAGYLKFYNQSSVHISDRFYLDPNHNLHSINFTLLEASVFRVFVQPLEFDADLYLYQLDQSTKQLMSSPIATSINQMYEETIFLQLDGNFSYTLFLSYYTWDSGFSTQCPELYLELAVESLAYLQSSALLCNGKNRVDPLSEYAEPIAINSSGLTFTPSTNFVVDANSLSRSLFFFSKKINIDSVANKKALIRIETGFQFLVGDVAILLEKVTSDHCGPIQPSSSANCSPGKRFQNTEIFEAVVETGHVYTLWLYSTSSLKNIINAFNCVSYTFDLKVSIIDPLLRKIECPGQRLPSDLNQAGLLTSTGHSDVYGNFLILDSFTTVFNLSQPSFLKVSMTADLASTIYLKASNQSLVNYVQSLAKQSAVFGLLLDSGLWQITFVIGAQSISQQSSDLCPTPLIQLRMEPNTAYESPCSAAGPEKLPLIESSRAKPLTPPFEFGYNDFYASGGVQEPTTYVAMRQNFLSGTLASFFISSNNSFSLVASVASSFLFDTIAVHLEGPSGRVVYGIFRYNLNLLESVLEAGEYTLSIRIRTLPVDQNDPCVMFNFYVNIQELVGASGMPGCLSISAEPIPNTLNGVRFLGNSNLPLKFPNSSSNKLNYASTFRAKYTGSTGYHSIAFKSLADSMFRISVGPLASYMDITIGLYNANSTLLASQQTDSSTRVRSIVVELQAFTEYVVKLFFFASGTLPACPTFQMGFAFGAIKALPESCNSQSSDHWPPAIPTSIDLPLVPFYYDSTTLGEHLFFQQTTTLSRSHVMDFNVSADSILHSELGYDFLSGDMLLYLINQKSGDAFFAKKDINKCVLHVNLLTPGSYRLYLSESAINVAGVMGCSHFNFLLDIEAYVYQQIAPAVAIMPTVPSSLNQIQYYAFDFSVHFSRTFRLTQRTQVSFQLQLDSYVHVRVSNSNNRDTLVSLFKGLYPNSNTLVSSSVASFDLLLQSPSDYAIIFVPPVTDEAFDIEIAIQPATIIDPLIAAANHSNCITALLDSQIDFNPGNPYFFSKSMSVAPADNFAGILTSTSFVIYEPAFFFAMSSFDFLPFSLTFSLVSTNGENFPPTYRKNQAEIYELLPAGSYTFSISSFDTRFLEMTNITNGYCAEYQLELVLSSQQRGYECVAFDILPTDLDNQSGGSVAFGGPLDKDGQLHIYGGRFRYLSQQPSSMISFTVKQTSLIGVLTQTFFDPLDSSSSAAAVVDFKVANTTVLTPFYSYSVGKFRRQTFVLSPGTYVVTLLYDINVRLPDCPYFSLGIDIQTIEEISDFMSCSDYATLPPSSLSLDENGFGLVWLEGNIPAGTSGLAFITRFETAQDSVVQLSIGFDSLISTFASQLFDYQTSETTIGVLSSQSSSTSSVTLNMLNNIRTSVAANNSYTITIRPRLLQGDGWRPSRVLCIPYSYLIQVSPASGSTFFRSINPSGSKAFPQDRDLIITITLSQPFFNGYGEMVTNSNKEVLFQAFYLSTSDEDQRRESIDVSLMAVSMKDTHGLNWQLTFSGAKLVHGDSYLLLLHPGILFATDLSPLYIDAAHIYRIVPDCPQNMHFDQQSSSLQCVCDQGFAKSPLANSSSCDTCASGYTNYPYCQPAVTCDRCVNGNCNLLFGLCECNAHYTGHSCESCEYGWSIQSKCTACLANFDLNTGCSSCLPHFTGTLCDVCSTGFTGTNCSQCMTHRTGPNCDQCVTHWTGANCDVCSTGFTGTNCNQCETHRTGPNCDQCELHWTGPSCSECATGFTGSNCDKCITHFTGPNCDQCELHFTGPSCSECAAGFTGTNCSQCMTHRTGPNCDQCETRWTGANCDACAAAFSGTNCDQCAPHRTGLDCNICEEFFIGSNCDRCVPHRSGEDCSKCATNFMGINCTDCADGFTGEDCSEIVIPPSLSLLEIVMIIISVLIVVAFIVLVAVLLTIRVWKQTPFGYRKLTEGEEGIELDSNVIMMDSDDEQDNSLISADDDIDHLPRF